MFMNIFETQLHSMLDTKIFWSSILHSAQEFFFVRRAKNIPQVFGKPTEKVFGLPTCTQSI
jgi:hypothetical protein